MKYPKPGYPNPIVGVYIFDLAAFQQSQKKHENPNVEEFIREVDWQRRRDREDSVIMEVAWVANSSLLIKEVSRAADEGAVVIVDLVNQRASGKGLLADGKVARILGKDGEQGDEGWIDNVSWSFLIRSSNLLLLRNNTSTASPKNSASTKEPTSISSPPQMASTKSPYTTLVRQINRAGSPQAKKK